MKTLVAALILGITAAALIVPDADARPLGGRKSIGMKRDSTPAATPAAPAATPAAPAATPAAAAKPAAPAATPAAPAPSGASKWLGPLAGFAAGGLLASLLFGGGFSGIKFFDILLILGMLIAAFMIFRALARRAAPASAPMQYAPAGGPAAGPVPMPVMERPSGVTPEIGSKLMSPAAIDDATAAPRIPADFDVEPFMRQGKVAFMRLQAANDARDLDDIRDFTTPEMYAELAMQIQERGDAPQKTEILAMDAKLLEVVTEGNRKIASVRFTGTWRDAPSGPTESLDEVWHVVKRLDQKDATWLLAGIQQVE